MTGSENWSLVGKLVVGKLVEPAGSGGSTSDILPFGQLVRFLGLHCDQIVTIVTAAHLSAKTVEIYQLY